MKNARAKRAKLLFSLSNMQIYDVHVTVIIVVAKKCPSEGGLEDLRSAFKMASKCLK